MFHQENDYPHSLIVICLMLRESGCEVLIHPSYSLDLSVPGERLPQGNPENRLSKFFANMDDCFYKSIITKLPSKCQQVIQQNSV